MLNPLFPSDATVIRAGGSLPHQQARGADVIIVVDPLSRKTRMDRSMGFSYERSFAALPDAREPRWLIPLDAGPIRAGAFAFHAPYRRTARAKYALVRLAARLGTLYWSRHVVSLYARSTPPLESWMNETIGVPVRLGFARGAVGARPKPIAVALDRGGRAVAFAKLGRDTERRRALRNEARALKALAQLSKTADMAPRLLGEADLSGTYVTLQEPVAGAPGPATLTDCHHRFLQALSRADSRPVIASTFVHNVLLRASGADAVMLKRVISMVGDAQLPRVIVHGDFAPWNLRLKDGQLRAFDWEWSCDDGLPLVDALHHRLQAGFLLHGWSAARAAGPLEAEAQSRPFGLGPVQARAIQAMSILDYVIHIAEDGYRPEALAARYRELLARTIAVSANSELGHSS